ncbi:MAG: hypothetical protein AAF488_17890, partial [Planctomycetota bacterium]
MRVLVLALLISVGIAGANDDGVERIPRNSKDHKVSIDVPVSWSTAEYDAPQKHCVVALRGEIVHPDLGKRHVQVLVFQLPTSTQPPHQLHLDAMVKRAEGSKVTLHRTPKMHLHVEMEAEDGEKFVDLIAARTVKGQCFSVVVSTAPDAAPALVSELFAIVASIRSEHPPYVAAPKDFKRSEKHKVLWHVYPKCPRKELKKIQNAVRAAQKRFEKRHGARKDAAPEFRTNLIVVRSDDMARSIHKAVEMKDGFGVAGHSSWMIVRPFVKTARADFTLLLTECLFSERYRSRYPMVFSYGEAYVAWSEIEAGA